MSRTTPVVALVVVTALAFGCENWRNRNADTQSSKSTTQSKMHGQKKLYERLGGEPAIRAVIDDFVPRTAGNPKVNFTRNGIPGNDWQPTDQNVAHLKEMLVLFVASATGGPQKYTGEDMRTSHKGMKITNAEFDAMARDLSASLKKLNVPQREHDELLAVVETTRTDIVGR